MTNFPSSLLYRDEAISLQKLQQAIARFQRQPSSESDEEQTPTIPLSSLSLTFFNVRNALGATALAQISSDKLAFDSPFYRAFNAAQNAVTTLAHNPAVPVDLGAALEELNLAILSIWDQEA